MVCPSDLWTIARRKLDQLDSVKEINELQIPPGNRLESLSGNYLLCIPIESVNLR